MDGATKIDRIGLLVGAVVPSDFLARAWEENFGKIYHRFSARLEDILADEYF